jgi:surface protein
MKTLNNYINEALIKKDTNVSIYKYCPKDKDELKSLIEKLLKERGKNADLNDVDVSNIIYMSWLFYDLDPHNIDISEWNVSKVKDMKCMFDGCYNFNSNLSKWDVKNVKDMYHMFWKCYNFNSNLSKWDVKNVKDKTNMFYKCTSLKNKPSWYKE